MSSGRKKLNARIPTQTEPRKLIAGLIPIRKNKISQAVKFTFVFPFTKTEPNENAFECDERQIKNMLWYLLQRNEIKEHQMRRCPRITGTL